VPLPAFIEQLYRKRFDKDRTDVVLSRRPRARKEENGWALQLKIATRLISGSPRPVRAPDRRAGQGSLCGQSAGS
jgi:hypothetical protein